MGSDEADAAYKTVQWSVALLVAEIG